MQEHSSPVLVAILEYGELPELLYVAESARTALGAPVVFFFVKKAYRTLHEDTSAVVARGFHWMDHAGTLHTAPAAPTPVAAMAAVVLTAAPDAVAEDAMPSQRRDTTRFDTLRLATEILVRTPGELLRAALETGRRIGRDAANLLRDAKRFKQRSCQLDLILGKLKPCLLIVAQDTPATELTFLLIAAGKQAIPRLITPFAMFSLNETADYALSQSAYHVNAGLMNRLAARLYPQWRLNYKQHPLLRLPGYRAIALELTGQIKGLPWTPLSEPVEAITASADVAADTLTGLGVDSRRLHVIGSPVHDRLAALLADKDVLRQQICARHGLNARQPLLVCGWPVNMFSWLAGRRIVYPDYAAVANTWASILKEVRDSHGINVVISVHPKTLHEETAAATAAGLPYQRGESEELVAACDLFTTLNGSSITSWAIACSIPAVLFDCFETHYPDFHGIEGCINVENEHDFASALHRLCSDSSERKRLAEGQRAVSQRWGKLDGQAGARLQKLILQLAKSSAA